MVALVPPPERIDRVAFLGTPAIAVPPLKALIASDFDVRIVISNPDKRRGRGGGTQPSPVKSTAMKAGIAVSDEPDDLRLLDGEIDLAIVVAYGRLLRAPLLERIPFVNIHFSLLPRWRGAAPVERAILAGDTKTGVCLMQVAEGLDTGDVYARSEVPIGPRMRAAELRQKLVVAGTDLLMNELNHGWWEPEPQHGEPTYAAKLTNDDVHLDWSRPAVELDRVVRIGGAWTTYRGLRFRIHEAAPAAGDGSLAPGEVGDPPDGFDRHEVMAVGCGDGVLVVEEVQAEGKARVAAGAWRNGARLDDREVLGP